MGCNISEVGLYWSGKAFVLYCTVHKLYTHWHTCVQCTVYCSIAEEFRSDDEVNISTESKDAEATEEVYIFWKIGPTLIANCSAHRPPPGMFQYSMERYCRQDSKKYEVNVRGGL